MADPLSEARLKEIETGLFFSKKGDREIMQTLIAEVRRLHGVAAEQVEILWGEGFWEHVDALKQREPWLQATLEARERGNG